MTPFWYYYAAFVVFIQVIRTLAGISEQLEVGNYGLMFCSICGAVILVVLMVKLVRAA